MAPALMRRCLFVDEDKMMLDMKNWRDRAACRDYAPSRYYDPWDVPESMWEPPDDLAQICERCPVRVECLVDALDRNDACVRAGTTRRQRDALKRPRIRESCPVCSGRLVTRIRNETEICVSCGLTWRIPKREELVVS